MHIDQIISNLQTIEAAAQAEGKKKPAAKKIPTPAAAVTSEAVLRFSLERFVAAADLTASKGLTAEDLVGLVNRYEQQYQGTVQ